MREIPITFFTSESLKKRSERPCALIAARFSTCNGQKTDASASTERIGAAGNQESPYSTDTSGAANTEMPNMHGTKINIEVRSEVRKALRRTAGSREMEAKIGRPTRLRMLPTNEAGACCVFWATL